MNDFSPLSDNDCIQDGANPSAGVFILISTVGNDYDNPETRISVCKNDAWFDISIEGIDATSIDASNDGRAYVLGEDGTIVVFNWRKCQDDDQLFDLAEIIETDMEYVGPLNVIRILRDGVVCGGHRGELFRFAKSNLVALPTLVVGTGDVTIEDICGTNVDDFLAITDEGYCASFDGRKWHQIDLPTNVRLASACLMRNMDFAIAGDKGTVLIGKGNDWTIIRSDDADRDYSGIAEYNGIVYASHPTGVDFVENGELVPLEIQDAENIDFVGLRSGPDGVWSLGVLSLGQIKEKQWRTVLPV